MLIIKSIREVNEAIANVSRRMRGVTPEGTKRNEAIAARTVKKLGDRHVKYMRGIFEAIPDLPSYQSVLIDQRKDIGDFEAFERKECAEGCSHIVSKAFPGSLSAAQINYDFIASFGAGINEQFEKLAGDYIRDVVGESPLSLEGSDTIYGAGMNEGLQAYVNDARERARQEWEKQPKYWKDQNPFPEFFNATFWKDAAFVNVIRDRGFRLVTSKITNEFNLRAKYMLVEGLKKYDPWNKISRDMNRTFGIRADGQGAGLYHWQRLVRSEMADAISKASSETYKESGAEAMKYSAALGRCPICDFWATENNGIYNWDSAPDIIGDTHANCRCIKLPIYNLNPDTVMNLVTPTNPHVR